MKERLFGLTGPQGNHGEDVKEEYFYLDSTPTHSYMKALYKYPQAAFPYARLVEENARRGKTEPEFELIDTGAFDQGRYFDVVAEYAKAAPDDILIRISISNRGPDTATVHLLPTVWFRNTWTWGCTHEGCSLRPRLRAAGGGQVVGTHESLGDVRLDCGNGPDGRAPRLLFTENETNTDKLWQNGDAQGFFKDAFHEVIVNGRAEAVNPAAIGSKSAAHYELTLGPGATEVIRLRLVCGQPTATGSRRGHEADMPGASENPPPHVGDYEVTPVNDGLGKEFDAIFATRLNEANAFFDSLCSASQPADERAVVRQAYAGLLWSKQFYHLVVEDWLKGDPGATPPPGDRLTGRNAEWKHLYSRDIISMPDKWEYPWFAAWDLAFHMIPFARLDGKFAKDQLSLFLREWYMHPNGQIPAYEFAFGDVNPPVHAWAAWRVYKIADRAGTRDRDFLESVFQKLLMNFTWWVNRKDAQGKNLFSGGFLGLDNIGVFDRSKPLPTGGTLQQADGTAWMAFYSATMLSMALELAWDGERVRPAYEDMASKFFEHFVQIVDAMNTLGGTGLWDEADGFYYDQILFDHHVVPLKTRSLVGLLPLIAVEVLDEETCRRLPGFSKRMNWFLKNRPELSRHIVRSEDARGLRLLAIPSQDQLRRVLSYMLDEKEFLSPFGIRSLSRFHEEQPYEFHADGEVHRVDYVPGESNTYLFGGNSNWRGPIWFPTNYLLIEALERYHHFYGDSFEVECPTGSGRRMNLQQVAREIEARLAGLFLRGPDGRRACHGEDRRWADDPHWRELVLFYEYFHGETGRGLGASHQTGWSALIVRLMKDAGSEARNQTGLPKAEVTRSP